MTASVIHADCLEAMRAMEANSIDAIVTDPPYGLEFMGKGWDAPWKQEGSVLHDPSVVGGFQDGNGGNPFSRSRIRYGGGGSASQGFQVWCEEWAREALRVAKPGAHLVAFGGTRMYHRLACAIEDAGWEVRDCLSWLYGSGFPKSLDVSKAIDKLDATDEQERRRFRFTEWVRSTGATARQIDEATGTRMGGHYTSSASQPAIMTREHLDACRHLLGDVPEWVERECEIRSVESANFASREVIGSAEVPIGPGFAGEVYQGTGNTGSKIVPLTAPATDAARQWQGWGTALKPAWEPAILARKPLIGTVAANVLAHGTGAINVDACRIGEGSTVTYHTAEMGYHGGNLPSAYVTGSPRGRWPANVALDEEAAAMLGEPSRFFYTAKASRRERGEGNTHPTVKPLSLMRWVVRLVTPPGGLVLDPFAGSGTTLLAARAEGFDAVGVEREAEYVEIIRRRLSESRDLFSEAT